MVFTINVLAMLCRARVLIMCNLYSMTRVPEAVRRMFGVAHNRAASFDPVPAIFPGYVAPIVRKASDGERELVTMN